jgi:hypothetical protein
MCSAPICCGCGIPNTVCCCLPEVPFVRSYSNTVVSQAVVAFTVALVFGSLGFTHAFLYYILFVTILTLIYVMMWYFQPPFFDPCSRLFVFSAGVAGLIIGWTLTSRPISSTVELRH